MPELSLGEDFHSHPYPVFEGFVSEELSAADYAELRKCFILNDIRNLSSALKNSGSPETFCTPSYYRADELAEGLNDPDTLFPFLADFVWDIRAEKRQLPSMSEENELLNRMMELISESDKAPFSGFPRDYLIFEMQLRNLTTALAGRSENHDYLDDIIPFDDFSSKIAVNQAADFGLGGELGNMAALLDMYGSASPLEIEQSITAVRWAWLDERVDYHIFSKEAVFAFSVKIADVERWLDLSPEQGRKQLDKLLEQLHQDIRKMTREENSDDHR